MCQEKVCTGLFQVLAILKRVNHLYTCAIKLYHDCAILEVWLHFHDVYPQNINTDCGHVYIVVK